MIPNFDLNVYSDELFDFTEAEYDAVMADSFEGYAEWSTELEADAWQGAQSVSGILIKKACEHQTCSHFKCEREMRIGGIAI
jgi:hypothetical protein